VTLPDRGRTFVRELAGPADAPVVMLLHGWTATAALNWHPCFAPLAEHFRVIAPDHRGHGRGLRADAPFRLEHCADDVAALARELGISSFIAVGYSMGGCVAQLLWQRHPDLVSGLVLSATSSTFNGTPREKVLFGVAAATSTLAGAVPLDRLSVAAVKAWSGWSKLRRRAWWGLDEVAGHDWAKIVEAGHRIGRFDSRGWISEVSVPAAVIATDDDDVVPLRRQLDLAAAIPTATLRRIPGGHTTCTLAPQQFAATLVACCAEVARMSTQRSTCAAAPADRPLAA
jgi:pimeloyl-ACP methyl ester carboxylesterase